MRNSYNNASKDFLDLASEQRLDILFHLMQEKSKISPMAKKLDSTVQEVHRNFERLAKSGFIEKDIDGYYHLTVYGTTMCTQIPTMMFFSNNRKYFQEHDFGDIPAKFIERIGALSTGKYIKGFTKVIEQWKSIYKNANEYIYEVHSEVSNDLIEPLIKKARDENVKINYVLSENCIVPKGRKKTLEKFGFGKLLEDGTIERKMSKNVLVVVALNEKEACVSFPDKNGESNIGHAFYGNDVRFHEWCLDYFRYSWYNSGVFRESKLKEE